MKKIQSAEDWMVLSAAYELLSLGFLLPTKETIQVLVSGEFGDACFEVCSSLEADYVQEEMIRDYLSGYLDTDCDQRLHEVRREYTRLFVGEKTPLTTPYIGIWEAEEAGTEGLLFVSQGSVEIEHFMRGRGVAKNLAAGQTNSPVDHVGTVCEFLQYLCLVNAHAIKAPDGFEVKSDDYARFLASHFTPYASWLSERLLLISQNPFYKAMALLLGVVLSASAWFKE